MYYKYLKFNKSSYIDLSIHKISGDINLSITEFYSSLEEKFVARDLIQI